MIVGSSRSGRPVARRRIFRAPGARTGLTLGAATRIGRFRSQSRARDPTAAPRTSPATRFAHLLEKEALKKARDDRSRGARSIPEVLAAGDRYDEIETVASGAGHRAVPDPPLHHDLAPASRGFPREPYHRARPHRTQTPSTRGLEEVRAGRHGRGLRSARSCGRRQKTQRHERTRDERGRRAKTGSEQHTEGSRVHWLRPRRTSIHVWSLSLAE